WRGALGPSDVAQREHRPNVGAESGRDIGPSAHVLRLLLAPDHLFTVRIRIHDPSDVLRPGIELLDPRDRDGRGALSLDEIVVDLPGAEDESPHLVASPLRRGI